MDIKKIVYSVKELVDFSLELDEDVVSLKVTVVISKHLTWRVYYDADKFSNGDGFPKEDFGKSLVLNPMINSYFFHTEDHVRLVEFIDSTIEKVKGFIESQDEEFKEILSKEIIQSIAIAALQDKLDRYDDFSIETKFECDGD